MFVLVLVCIYRLWIPPVLVTVKYLCISTSNSPKWVHAGSLSLWDSLRSPEVEAPTSAKQTIIRHEFPWVWVWVGNHVSFVPAWFRKWIAGILTYWSELWNGNSWVLCMQQSGGYCSVFPFSSFPDTIVIWLNGLKKSGDCVTRGVCVKRGFPISSLV